MFIKQLYLFVTLLVCATANADLPREDIKFITAQAIVICEKIEFKGSGKNINVDGSASVELNKLVKIFVNPSLDGKINYTSDEYEGFIRTDLLSAYSSNIECRQKFATQLLSFLSDDIKKKKNENSKVGIYSIIANKSSNIIENTKNRHEAITIESRDDSQGKTYPASVGYNIIPGSLRSKITGKRKGSRVNSSSNIQGNAVVASMRVRDNPKPFSGRGKATFEIWWNEQKPGIERSSETVVSNKSLKCGESYSHSLPSNTESFSLNITTVDGVAHVYTGNYSNHLYSVVFNETSKKLIISSCES